MELENRKPIYRMYIDEVGNADLKSSDETNHRFLGLTGIIMKMDYVRYTFHPLIEKLKTNIFASHPDDPNILRHKEIVNAKPPFHILRDEQKRQTFDNSLLSIMTDCNYLVCSGVIDKKAHKEQYTTWRFDPYHYALTILMERHILYLDSIQSIGDILAEYRDGKEDRRLKESFERIYLKGSDYV